MTWAWFDAGEGRQVYRRVQEHLDRRSDLPAPMVVLDTMPPAQSAADGKVYTSKSGIRASYKPGGNPHGSEYIEVGNDPNRLKPRAKPQTDAKGVREAVEKAVARLKN